MTYAARKGVISLQAKPSVELDRHIEITPDVRRGRPRIAGTRLAVADVVVLHLRMNRPLEVISADYSVPLAALYAALAYYYHHRAEIDASIEDDNAYVEAFEKRNPSLLRQKLRLLNGD